MRKQMFSLAASLLVIGVLSSACAQPAPSPTPTTTTTPKTSPASPVPKASPTPTAAPVEAPQYGGVLRVGRTAPPRGLHPSNLTIDGTYLKTAHDTLLRLDEKGELAPWLATEWKFSPDNKSITLTLRRGVKFHDGTDFNAAAAKWNMELRKAAKVGDYEEITSIDVIDDYTVRLNLSKFTNTFLISLWNIGGTMSSQAAYQKDGADQARWNPVGTGPFKFVRYETDVLIKYERFDGYWQKGKPYLNGYEVAIIVDATTRAASLRKGDVHVVEVDAKDAVELQKLGLGNLWPSPRSINFLVPDSANPDSPFADKRVREAVEYAVDRKGLSDALGYGLSEPINQITVASGYGHVPDLTGRPYNPDKAKQLLAAAGYANGLKTTIYAMPNFGASPFLTGAVSNLKAVGIDATIETATSGRFQQLTQGGWRNGLIGRGGLSVEPDWLRTTYAMLAATAIENKSLLRPPGWQDLWDQAMAATDMATKRERAQQIVKKASDEAMIIPLWSAGPGTMYYKTVRNLEWLGTWGANRLWSPADTWLGK
ncbi:MAG: ABC transporter substrate-binding protein [Chloroflexi bacterium]|nr:ABC transporter substrate-binding protein [Chloroflexota bacterium]